MQKQITQKETMKMHTEIGHKKSIIPISDFCRRTSNLQKVPIIFWQQDSLDGLQQLEGEAERLPDIPLDLLLHRGMGF